MSEGGGAGGVLAQIKGMRAEREAKMGAEAITETAPAEPGVSKARLRVGLPLEQRFPVTSGIVRLASPANAPAVPLDDFDMLPVSIRCSLSSNVHHQDDIASVCLELFYEKHASRKQYYVFQSAAHMKKNRHVCLVPLGDGEILGMSLDVSVGGAHCADLKGYINASALIERAGPHVLKVKGEDAWSTDIAGRKHLDGYRRASWKIERLDMRLIGNPFSSAPLFAPVEIRLELNGPLPKCDPYVVLSRAADREVLSKTEVLKSSAIRDVIRGVAPISWIQRLRVVHLASITYGSDDPSVDFVLMDYNSIRVDGEVARATVPFVRLLASADSPFKNEIAGKGGHGA